jgi:hypothetical protein
MNKAIFTLIPTGVSLLYAAGELLMYSMNGRMFFSSTFLPEIIVYLILGLLYIYAAVRLDKSIYLKPAISGLIIGIIILVAAGVKLFFGFEFARDLSV